MSETTGAEAAAAIADEAAPVAIDAAPSPPRRRWRRRRVAQAVVFGFLALVGGAVAILAQTGTGQRMVLNEMLDRLRGQLRGELRVGSISSQTLLAGFTLSDVRLDAEDGVRVLEADSVLLRYSTLSLLMGRPRLSSSTFYGLDLEVTRRSGEADLNVQRILADRSAPDDPMAPDRPTTLELGRISVRGGRVSLLLPADEPSRMTVMGPDRSLTRRMVFEELDLDLEETVVRPGGAIAFDARLGSFAAAVHVLERPVIVQAAVGDLTFGAEGIRIESGSFRLPGSLLEGDLSVGPDQPGDSWTFAADLRSDGWGDLSDLRWIDARFADGRFRGGAQVRTGRGLELTLDELEVQQGASSVVAQGGMRFDEGLSLSQLVVDASPIALASLAPWMDAELPLDGFVSGRATLSGSADSLVTDGRLTLVPTGFGGEPTTAEFSGAVVLADDPGASQLAIRLDPLNYRVLEAWWPVASSLGPGNGSLELEGRAGEGIAVTADFTHGSDASLTRVSGRGVLRRDESGEWATDFSGDVAPLSLSLVAALRPDLDVRGSVSGPVRLVGSVDDLRFEGDLAAAGGRITLTGSADLTSLGSAYAVELDAEGVSLESLTDRVPGPSTVSGHVTLRASGLTLDSLEGVASVAMRPSLVGGARIRSGAASLRTSGGLLTIDTLDLDVSGARVAGSGTMGLVAAVEGDARFAFTVDSLLSLRPLVMGDSILVRDGLSPLEQDLLRVRGIEPDTLPSELDVRMSGSVRGTADLRGHVRDLAARIEFEGLGLEFRHNAIDSARVELVASGLPDTRGDWMGNVRARGITWEERDFAAVDFDGTMSQRRGGGTLNVTRRPDERYFATGEFALDSVGGLVALSDASLQIDDRSWAMTRPTRITWDSTSVSVDSLEIQSLGDDPARLVARGTLTRGGESDFRLDLEGLHVEDATRIMQREDVDVAGHIDLSVELLGPAESPSIDALFEVTGPRYGALALSRLTGVLQYRDRSSEFRVEAWDGERDVLSAVGTLPLDLALTDVERRSVDEPMDVRVTADSLDAGIAFAYLRSLENVTGIVSADLRVRGTSREPAPSGTVRLADAAWTIEALGVRHTGIDGELELRPDRTISVRLETSRSGRSTVSGVVTLPPDSASNPRLDLLVSLDRFRAVSRRDIVGVLSGAFTVRGNYRLPVAEGNLRVDEAALYIEEFARSAAVVDLRDPTLFADGFAVDTTVFVTQPILAGLRNPFLDNLRVDIDLSVPRNLWLRSDEMNVEIGGELLVRYDRSQNDLVMVGDLQALRGSYQVLGRTFEVDGGTVSFLGQPGVNPTLDIQALSRIRRRQGDRLEVRAAVTGTLVQPLVTLSTAEAGLSQPDLVSYLLFGVPSGELGVGGAGAGSGAGGGLGDDVMAGANTIWTGQLASQLGTDLAQNIGFDYFAVSQGNVVGTTEADAGFFNTAQFEVGRYFGDDVFVVLVVSAPSDAAQAQGVGVGASFFRGVRVEWALSDEWFVEGFVEDRFLRGSASLGQAGLDGEEVVGMLVVREWGFGSPE